MVTLRPVDLDRDRQTILELLQRNLPGLAHSRRFEWLYCKNPAGRAWSWAIYEERTQEPIGVASVFPRTVWLGGGVAKCGQVGDFAVDVRYRSLGPALTLQRATFEPVNQGLLAFCYDCPPHDQGMAPFRRLGMGANCQVERYAKLQKSRRELEKRLRNGKLAVFLSPLADFFLSRRSFRGHKDSGIEITNHEGPFGDEFTRLDEQARNGGDIRSCRDAPTLNWRFLGDPLNTYRLLTARRFGELIGYAVVTVRGDDAFVTDLFALNLSEVGPELLDAVAETTKAEPVQALYVLAGDQSGMSPILRQNGFRFRSRVANVVSYARPSTVAQELLNRRANWFFAHVDLLA
jgi:hypothetical protein